MSADFDGDQTHCFLFVIIKSASANAPDTERERMSLNHDPTKMSIAGLVRRRRWSCFFAWSIAWALAGASFPYDSARSSTGPFCRLKLSAQLIRPT